MSLENHLPVSIYEKLSNTAKKPSKNCTLVPSRVIINEDSDSESSLDSSLSCEDNSDVTDDVKPAIRFIPPWKIAAFPNKGSTRARSGNILKDVNHSLANLNNETTRQVKEENAIIDENFYMCHKPTVKKTEEQSDLPRDTIESTVHANVSSLSKAQGTSKENTRDQITSSISRITSSISKVTSSVACQTDRCLMRNVTKPLEKLPSADLAKVVVNGKDYVILSDIGRGGSSKVEQVFDVELKRRLALKTVDLANQNAAIIEGFLKEISMLEKLQISDKIIQLIDYEQNKMDNKLLILMECGDTDLEVYLRKRLNEKKSIHKLKRWAIWHGMLQAVQVLHSMGIIHSDIKPANFMLVAGEIKIIDFGIAKQLDTDVTSMVLDNCVGTLNYMAPEVLQNIGSEDAIRKAGRKADVWALGCILYYMAFGERLFQSLPLCEKIAAIVSSENIIKYPDVDEPDLISTLQMCLERDPKKRASVDTLLEQPYIK